MDDIIWNTAGVVLIIAGLTIGYFGWTTREPPPKEVIPEWPDPSCCGRVGGKCHCQQIEECIYNDL